MARPSVNQLVQVGVESTYGTGVTAAKRFSSTGVMFSPSANSSFYRQAGSRFPTTGVQHRKWAIGSYDGILSFNEIVYPLASMFGHGTVTTTLGASTWPITPNSSGSDAYKTYTIQRGDSIAAQEVNGAAFTSLTIDFTQEAVSVSGDILARTIDNGATLDSVTDTIDEAPVSMADVDVFIDATSAGLGTTKWAEVMSATLTLPAKVAPKFVLNTTYQSIRELVEVAMEDARLVIRAEADTQTRAIYDAVYVDSLPFRFIRINADGDLIPGGGVLPFRFRGDFAVKCESVAMIDNVQETYGMEFSFRLVHNEGWAKAMAFSIVNTIAAL